MLKTCSEGLGVARSSELVDTVSSLTLFFSNVGEILGPLLGGFLVGKLGYRISFLVMSLLSLVFFLMYSLSTNVFNLIRYPKLSEVEFRSLNQMTEEIKG